GNRLLVRHQAVPALLLDFVWNGRGEVVRDGAGDRLVAETADAIELRLGQPFQQLAEIVFGLPWKTDDEGRADGQVRAGLPPRSDSLQRPLLRRRPTHAFEHGRARVLERHV